MKWRRSNRRAVALIYFTLIFGVLLGFTMLISNTGLLIYQKIRLQSATDLAAYAGAAVQASYLGGHGSGEDSIKAINGRIQERYFKLLRDLQFGSRAPLPQGFVDPGTCMVACQAANVVNGNEVLRLYRQAVADIEQEHAKVRRILQQMPGAAQRAAEETLRLNIPELSIGQVGPMSQTTNDIAELLANESTNAFDKKKNAVLSFESAKGAYLANVVSGVPHTFTYFGPACFNATAGTTNAPYWFCMANGAGATHSYAGLSMAMAAWARGMAGGEASGNIGNIKKIADMNSNAIRLHFVEDAFKPQPFMMVAAEWYPEQGAYMNLEGSMGANGSLFTQRTRLAAVSAAEPFGSSLVSNAAQAFGVRLTGIRKVLLDPRIKPVADDYGGVFDYMEFIGPRDERGQTVESAEDVIKRFLH